MTIKVTLEFMRAIGICHELLTLNGIRPSAQLCKSRTCLFWLPNRPLPKSNEILVDTFVDICKHTGLTPRQLAGETDPNKETLEVIVVDPMGYGGEFVFVPHKTINEVQAKLNEESSSPSQNKELRLDTILKKLNTSWVNILWEGKRSVDKEPPDNVKDVFDPLAAAILTMLCAQRLPLDDNFDCKTVCTRLAESKRFTSSPAQDIVGNALEYLCCLNYLLKVGNGLFRVLTMDESAIDSILNMRIQLEEMLLERLFSSSKRDVDQALVRMKKYNDKMLASFNAAVKEGPKWDSSIYIENDLKFHLALTNQEREAMMALGYLISRLRLAFGLVNTPDKEGIDRMRLGLAEHKKIIDAIKSGSLFRAKAAVLSHLLGAFDRLNAARCQVPT